MTPMTFSDVLDALAYLVGQDPKPVAVLGQVSHETPTKAPPC